MRLKTLAADVLRISDIYAAEHDIDRDERGPDQDPDSRGRPRELGHTRNRAVDDTAREPHGGDHHDPAEAREKRRSSRQIHRRPYSGTRVCCTTEVRTASALTPSISASGRS